MLGKQTQKCPSASRPETEPADLVATPWLALPARRRAESAIGTHVKLPPTQFEGRLPWKTTSLAPEIALVMRSTPITESDQCSSAAISGAKDVVFQGSLPS